MEVTTTEKKGKICLDKKTLEYIFPAVHFLLTFLLERICFVFSDNFSFVNEIAKNNYVSDRMELIIVYVLSKIWAAIIIWLFWKMVFGVINKKIPLSVAVLFGIVYLIGLVIGLFCYPDFVSLSIDNYTNYSMSIRFLPTYWQSVYTGALYAGCMMVFPHPFAIFIFQWMAFVGVTAYIYMGLEKLFPGRNVKLGALLLLALPETYYMMFDQYRNNYYAMLCLFYFAYLIFSLRDTEKEFKTREMVVFTVLSAFIMVWRSEGILIGAGGMLVLFFIYKVNWKKAISLFVICMCAFFVLNSIQGIGAKKYYGQDYMIINTADVLRSILNDPNANLSYAGVEADLTAIEAVVPVQVLKEDGLAGLRNYNWTVGNLNFNQTLASDEDAEGYMKAYYHIISKNIPGYLDVQVNCLYGALGINARHVTHYYSGERISGLEPFNYYRWLQGYEELRESTFTTDWETNETRQLFYGVFNWFMSAWREIWNASGLNTLLHVFMIIGNIFLLVVEAIKFFIYKEKKSIEYVLYFLILLGETAAVFLFMPVGRAAYFYPVLYVSYFVLYFYFMERIKKYEK